MAYPFYSNNQYYMQDLQNMKDKIDRQLQQMQQLNQQQQPIPQVTQNFQIAPTPVSNELESKYAESIDEVKNTFVMKTGLFINKDNTTLWIKNTNGDIKTFKLEEIVELDDRDKEIEMLKKQIEEMKGMIENEQSVNSNVDEQTTTKKSNNVQRNKSSYTK